MTRNVHDADDVDLSRGAENGVHRLEQDEYDVRCGSSIGPAASHSHSRRTWSHKILDIAHNPHKDRVHDDSSDAKH